MGKKEIRKPWSEKAGHGKIRHGEHSTRLHHIWRSFRLGRKKYRIYPDWEIYINFRNWALEAGYIPEKMMLRRKNKYLGYSPKNCYWLPRRKPISAFGETKKLEEWIRDKRCVLKYHEQLSRRLRRGMDPELALTYIRKHRPERRGRKKIKGLRRVWKEIEYDSFGWENFREFEWWLKQNGYKPGFRVVRKDHWKQWSPKNCMAVHRSEAFFYGLAVGGWDLHLFRAWGESKTITEWLEDRRCRCNCREILEERFRKKWRIEWAISLHPFWKREMNRHYKLIDSKGLEKTIYWWSRTPTRCKVTLRTFMERLNRGVPLDEALRWYRMSTEKKRWVPDPTGERKWI